MKKLVIILVFIASVFVAKSYSYAAVCNAEFTYTIVREISPLTISFSNHSNSVNPIISWEWNFGDGQNSSKPNPTHQYLSAGNYIVKLTIIDNIGNLSSFIDTLTLVDKVTIQSTANFNYSMLPSTSLHTYNFKDHSFAINDVIISWNWNFGDGSAIETTKNTTHTFLDIGIYTVVLTTTTTTGVTSSHTQQIVVSSVVAQCFADFSYVETSTNKINFTDLSTSNSGINQWHWDFGDGSSTNAQNPEHLYASPGIYYVKLTMYSAVGSDIVIIPVKVGVPLTYSFWGRVYVGNLTTDQCVAYLYQKCNNGCIHARDTIKLTSINDTLGIYYFYQIPEGNYYVNIDIPNTSNFYEDFAPTYYGNSPHWSQSQMIPLYNDMANMHIDMTPIVHQYGNNVLKGYAFGEDSIYRSNVLVLLYNSDNDLIDYTYTNTAGSYKFEEVPSGKFSVYGDLVGYISSPAITPNLGNGDTISGVNFVVSNGVSMGVIYNEIAKPIVEYSIFPNPAVNGRVNLRFEDNAASGYSYKIFNILGAEITSNRIELVGNDCQIITNDLLGVYLLAIYDSKQVLLSTKKLIIR